MISNNIPKLRFKDFDDEWEKEILNEIVQITMGQSPNSENYTENPSDHILVQGNADLQNKKVVPRVWTTQVTKTAEPNDIILSVRAPVGDVGKTDFPVVIGRGVAAIKGNDFIYHLLGKMKTTGFWNKYSTGSTFESISSNDIKTAEVHLPSLPEQTSIGSIFQTLDELLSAYKDNLVNYQAFKASMLSKMFPKTGQTTPEIRLDGFDSEWEEKKLSEVADYRNGKAHEKVINSSGAYVVVNSKFISTEGSVCKYSNIRIEPLFINDIAIVLSDVPNGRALAKTYLIKEDGKYTLNQRIAAITPRGDASFLNLVLNRNSYFLKFDDGVGQTNLSKGEVENFSFLLPSLPEQRAIGSFFSNFDNLISSYQDKIEQLETLKKKLLQDMFI